MQMRRLFAGVEVRASEDLRRALDGLREELRGERIRWTRLENLHLTVEFFGATPAEKIPALEKALASAAGKSEAFALNLGGLGLFGGLRHPRVLWMGARSEGLRILHDRVEEALRESGWTPEEREFAPHLTLGRIERLKDAEAFESALETRRGWSIPDQTVRELILYESVSGRYVPLGKWPLGRASGESPSGRFQGL